MGEWVSPRPLCRGSISFLYVSPEAGFRWNFCFMVWMGTLEP